MSAGSVRTILGTMEFGTRLSLSISEAMSQALNRFASETESATELDTAFMYAKGKSEEYIGRMDLRLIENVQIATKANPWDSK